MSLQSLSTRLEAGIKQVTTGGDWAITLPRVVRHNLHWFWFDGFFAAACDNITGTYIALYVLALGASREQIGFMSSLSSLSAAAMLFLGAMLVQKAGKRKRIILLSGGSNRTILLLMAALPFLLHGPALIYAAIFLSVGRDSFNNVLYPAWMSMTGDMVPLDVRGRYFASRNFATGISGIIVTLLAGQLISSTGQPAGYQLALGVAFLFGISSVFSFSHLKEPRNAELSHRQTPLISREMLSRLGGQPVFLSLCATAALWNFSINIAAPFFNVYLVQNLSASAAMVAVTGVASSITGLLVQRKLGVLADRWGSRRMQLISGLLIPILPWAWMLVAAPWQVIPINLLNGVIWGAYNLASFNFLLEVIPVNQRSSYSALYQIVVTLSLSAGAAVGGLVVSHWGYHTIFFLSGLGRVIAAALFARFVHTEIPAPRPAVRNTTS